MVGEGDMATGAAARPEPLPGQARMSVSATAPKIISNLGENLANVTVLHYRFAREGGLV
jgi:hypothetical protein